MSEFYIEKMEFDLEQLIVLSRSGSNLITVRFENPRAFRFFRESDANEYLSSYNSISTLFDAAPGTGLFKSEEARYVAEYVRDTPDDRLDESNFSYLLVTPDECVEVISFEDPTIHMAEQEA